MDQNQTFWFRVIFRDKRPPDTFQEGHFQIKINFKIVDFDLFRNGVFFWGKNSPNALEEMKITCFLQFTFLQKMSKTWA